jgi:hypothetical protein
MCFEIAFALETSAKKSPFREMNDDFVYGSVRQDFSQGSLRDRPRRRITPSTDCPMCSYRYCKRKTFNPDARMKKILTEANAVANATARAITFNPRSEEGFNYYGAKSHWLNSLFVGGYEFMTPPPEITKEGVKQYPSDGARKLNSRTWMFYLATVITPAMCMRLENVGSQYLFAALDDKDLPFDGGKSYKVTLPAKIPAARFWSLNVYDNQSRSLLETPQSYPRAGSQSYPSPAAKANPDGSTTVYFSPTQPKGVERGNWIQTTPGKGWCVLLRLYSPLKPFFDKSWRAGEIEEAK